ncbi:Clp protease ClpP [Hymenobacter cellulosivorans]|uniref:ATP-dependent Clp protease proteolytic subunit n=1 Tax=Hymenobacter cellulosivorans TaxID=2932249 RepID=A0ABY4F8R8_9BACT|nr:Clp protease ClpP [Hymenobacter cellulosivorans]UOQ53046.1 Clp protease ClpP [Hymenobacter cellulosivorans]
MAELLIPIREYIGKSEWNWETGEFEWATNADDVRMALEWAQYDGMEVTSICLEIGTCFGGSVTHGLEIYNYLKGLGLPIRTRILSLAASMGSVIPLVGDVVEIEQTAQVLVHGPSGYAGGTVREATSGLKQLSDLHNILRNVYVARTGQPVAVVEEWMSKDTWFTADEALALGLVTTVLPLAPKNTPAATTAQASARRAKFADIVARADKRTIRALTKPTPKAAAKRPAANASPKPMTKNVIPITKAVGQKSSAPTAEQQANAAAVLAFAKKLGVKATIESAGETAEVTAEAVGTVLADGAGTLYTDGVPALDSAVFNDEALTVPTDDGEYEAEDRRVITVAGGVVTDITEATAEDETETPAASTETLTAAITAALGPLVTRLDAMEGKVTAFSKVVPPTPKPRAQVAGSPQGDVKNPAKPKARGVLSGATAAKD